MKKRILAILLSCLMLVGLTACNGSDKKGGTSQSGNIVGSDIKVPEYLSGKTVKMLVWYQLPQNELDVIKRFEEETGIKVEYECSSESMSEYSQLIASKVAAGEGYDVCMMGKERFPQFTVDYLQPINKIVGEDGNLVYNADDSVWSKQTIEASTVNGDVYALNCSNNWQYDYVCMFYNEDLFASRGVKTPLEYYEEGNWNWDTFLECAKQMTYKENGNQVWGYAEQSAAYHYDWALSAGTDYVNFDGSTYTSNLTNSTLINAMEFVADLYTKHKVADPSVPYGVSQFAQGNSAMLSCITYIMKNDAVSLEGMTDSVKAVPFPNKTNDTDYIPVHQKGFGIMENATEPEAAYYWIRYWQDPANYDMDAIFVNTQYKEMFANLDGMTHIYPFSVGLLNYAGYLDSDKLNTQMCYVNTNQVAAQLANYANIMEQSCKKANLLFED